ncbi:hypothetical protein BHM03_00042940 [Ensete ventricosum]|nr:hypothetical protein BHM03_00042940 [Ensete ventricosum]
MIVEGQRDTKNIVLIPCLRTLVDSKLRDNHYRDRPPWNSIGVLCSNLMLKGFRKYSSIDDKK